MHFAARCRERGITETDPYVLADEIRQAVSMDGAGHMDRVMKTADGRGTIWRFSVPEGIFYAVVNNEGHPMTVLTQDMVRKKKWANKKRKKGHRRP